MRRKFVPKRIFGSVRKGVISAKVINSKEIAKK